MPAVQHLPELGLLMWPGAPTVAHGCCFAEAPKSSRLRAYKAHFVWCRHLSQIDIRIYQDLQMVAMALGRSLDILDIKLPAADHSGRLQLR